MCARGTRGLSTGGRRSMSSGPLLWPAAWVANCSGWPRRYAADTSYIAATLCRHLHVRAVCSLTMTSRASFPFCAPRRQALTTATLDWRHQCPKSRKRRGSKTENTELPPSLPRLLTLSPDPSPRPLKCAIPPACCKTCDPVSHSLVGWREERKEVLNRSANNHPISGCREVLWAQGEWGVSTGIYQASPPSP